MSTAKELPAGLYDLLHITQLHKRLEKAGLLERAVWSSFEAEEFHHHLAIPVAHEIVAFISETIAGKRGEALAQSLKEAFQTPELLCSIIEALRPLSAETLQQIKPPPPFSAPTLRPDTPLSVSALPTGSSRTPSLLTQLIKELASCDRADWLVSFIKFAGILPLLPALRKFHSERRTRWRSTPAYCDDLLYGSNRPEGHQELA